MDDAQKEEKKQEVVQEAKESLVLMFISQKIIAENKLKIIEPKTQDQPNPIQMAVDFDPMTFFKPNTPEQKNMAHSMNTLHTAQDFIIQKIQEKK